MNKFYFLPFFAAALVSCNNEQFEDFPQPDSSAVISFVATTNSDNFNNTDSSASRAVKNEFATGDKMTAFIERTSGEHYAKSEFTFGADGTLASNPEITYPSEAIDVYSFYPTDFINSNNVKNLGDMNSDTKWFTDKYTFIPNDQTNNSLSSTDLLYAVTKNQTNTGTPIKLVYDHVYAKFSIKVNPADGVEVQNIYIIGTKTKVSYTFDKEKGLVATASDGANPSIKVDVKTDEYAEAIVCPQSVAAGANLIKFVTNQGEKYLKVKEDGLNIEAGKNYNFDITISTSGDVENKLTVELQNEDSTPKLTFSNLSADAKLQVSTSETFTSYNEIDVALGTTEHLVSPSDMGDANYVGLLCYRLVEGNKESNIVTVHSHFDVTSGDGDTFQTAYVISNARHLKNIDKISAKKTFKQNADITLTDENFTPLCSGGFDGTFNGQNHSISGLTINTANGNVGLFAKINGTGYVRNVILKDVSITALGTSYTGAIAAESAGKIEACTVDGNITSSESSTAKPVGGIVGYNTKNILSCVNNITIDVKSKSIGGICGISEGGSIKQCGNNGNVTSTAANVGGIVGEVKKAITIEECFNKGNIKAQKSVGGIVGGGNNASTVMNCYNTGEIESTGDKIEINKDIACGIYSWGSNANFKVENCYNIGTIKSDGATFEDLNAITNNTNAPAENITNCFFLTGSASKASPTNPGEAKSDTDMKNQGTYEGWDFTKVWTVPTDGYPKLKWEPAE